MRRVICTNSIPSNIRRPYRDQVVPASSRIRADRAATAGARQEQPRRRSRVRENVGRAEGEFNVGSGVLRAGRSGLPASHSPKPATERTVNIPFPRSLYADFLPRLAAACLGFGATTVSLSAANLQFETTAAWVENINRAASPDDWRDSMRLSTRASLSQLREWRTGFTTTGEFNAGFEHVTRFPALNCVTVGAGAEARQKFGFGPYAPVLSVEAALRTREARLAGDDGCTQQAGVRFAKRFTPEWRIATVADWQQHDARRPNFDTRHRRVFGTVSWSPNDRWALLHGHGRLWGSFTSHASAESWIHALSGALGPEAARYYESLACDYTHAIGPGWATYRARGRIDFWWLELSPALGRNTSLPLRYERYVAVNEIGTKYRQEAWSLQLLHRF